MLSTPYLGSSVAAVPSLCSAAPRGSCRQPVRPGRAALLVRDATPDAGDQLVWKWRQGAATSLADFGDPTTQTSYVFCIFDGTDRAVLRTGIPAGGTCAGRPCWRPKGTTGLIYRNPAAVPDGATQLRLTSGGPGAAQIALTARGQHLAMLDLSAVTFPLRVQLQAASDGPCWEAVYTTDGVLRHDARRLKARDAAGTVIPPGGRQVRFFRVAGSSFDRYTANPTPQQQAWMRDRYWRMLVYTPYFDSRVTWFAAGWFYKDIYAIYPDSALVAQHPEWILRDAQGASLYIPYGCANGTCPQYAADPGSPAFRDQWIAAARAALAKGYRGIYVDDVNLTLSRVSDGSGRAVVPIDPRTNAPMAEADWRRYMAEFTEAIRAAFPQAEIVHNALWFLGHDDPAIQRQLLSADWINLERGVNDTGIRGGGGTYGFETFLGYVDWLHGHNRPIVLDADAKTPAAREYGLAAYLLLTAGNDALGNDQGGTPDDWWSGYDVSLGTLTAARYAWQGVLRRDFPQGLVLVNAPDAPAVTLDLGAPYLDLDGRSRTSVTLGPAAGVVLHVPPQAPAARGVTPVPN